MIHLDWIPPIPAIAWLAIGGVCLLGWIGVRMVQGQSLVGWRWAWIGMRSLCVAAVILIGLGPTLVEETQGPSQRPAITYLFDGSQSMKLGGERSRWEESLEFMSSAERLAGSSGSGDTRAFRFGHRLEPLISNTSAASNQQTPAIASPEASDSRLADALRQLTPQLDAKRSAGIVLFSDGRVRASDAVERMAEHLGQSGIPLHVVPVGEVTGTGDVAIVSLVTEPRCASSPRTS